MFVKDMDMLLLQVYTELVTTEVESSLILIISSILFIISCFHCFGLKVKILRLNVT